MWNVYYELNGKRIYFSFDEHEDFDKIFSIIHEKTGINVNLYDDVRLYPDHQKILVKLLKEKTGHEEVIKFFETSILDNEVVFFIGQ